MKIDQDWPSVWAGPRTFHPASVPLPIRQGFAYLRRQATPGKYANVELMKVPNFLHLTPPAIQKHCEAIKKFCTPWPKGTYTKYTVKYLYLVVPLYGAKYSKAQVIKACINKL